VAKFRENGLPLAQLAGCLARGSFEVERVREVLSSILKSSFFRIFYQPVYAITLQGSRKAF